MKFRLTGYVMFTYFLLLVNSGNAASADFQRITSLCENDEDIYFSCKIEGAGKIASVCAAQNTSPKDGYVQYRYGTRSKIDFKYPETLVPPQDRFSIVDVSRFATGTGTHLKFKNGDYQYVVSNALVPGEVYVVRKGKMVFDKMCEGTEYIPYLSKMRQGVLWGALDKTDGLDNH